MNAKSKNVVVRDRHGVLYALPSDLLEGRQIDEKDFESAAKFYLAADDDVIGQRVINEDIPWEDCNFDPRNCKGIPVLKI